MPTFYFIAARLADFRGNVLAWSFGDHEENIQSPGCEFELKVPNLGRTVPALIGLGLCSGSAETADGKQCLLHPVLTCVAGAGETFDPPLLLRFPVGDVDSMESGSEGGSRDEAEVAYRAHLGCVFSAVKREDADSEWVPINGGIVQIEGGVFVLEVAVKHFCEFALREMIDVGAGCAEPVPLPKLRFKSRESHYHFVNLGTRNLVVHCWGAARREPFVNVAKAKFGFAPSGANAGGEVGRTLVDVPSTEVFTFSVPGISATGNAPQICLPLNGAKSLTVAWTTQQRREPSWWLSWWSGDVGHELVQVWGKISMQSKHVLVFGPELESASPVVANLVVEDCKSAGTSVKAAVAPKAVAPQA